MNPEPDTRADDGPQRVRTDGANRASKRHSVRLVHVAERRGDTICGEAGVHGPLRNERRSVDHAHSGSQGADRSPPRAAGSLSLLQRRCRHPICGACPRIAGPRAELSRGLWVQPTDRRASRRSDQARGHRHGFARGGPGPREQPDQTAGTPVQHPVTRRQELSLSASDHHRGLSACSRRAAGGARRKLLRGSVSTGHIRPQDDVPHPPAVRDPFV